MEGLAVFGQTGLWEALGARSKGEKPRAACTRIVQREAGQHGVFSRLRGTGQLGVLRKRDGDDIIDHGGSVGRLHTACMSYLRRSLRRFPESASRWFFSLATDQI